jgi:HD-like signal output (HDOD) protein
MGFWDQLWRSFFGDGDGPPRANESGDGQNAGGAVATLTEPEAQRRKAKEEPEGERWWTPGEDALLDVVPPARLELPTEVLALDHGLAQSLQSADLRLPTLPKSAECVLRMLGGTRFSASQIAAELAKDQVLSAAVLRLANSALYGTSGQITDLRSAATRLGNMVLRTVAMQYSLQSAVRSNLARDRTLTDIVWNGSLASATIMRGLAECLWADDEEAYLIGLLHDIGNVLVLREVQEQQTFLRYRMALGPFEWLCYRHHEKLGRLVGDAWDLPDKTKALAANHHGAGVRGDPLARARSMIALTDMIKSMLGYATRRSYALLPSNPAQALGLAESPALAAFLDDLPAQLRGIKAVL